MVLLPSIRSAWVAVVALESVASVLAHPAAAQWSGVMATETAGFLGEAAPGAPDGLIGITGRLRSAWQWDERTQTAAVDLFVRVDLLGDGRSRVDFRELSYGKAGSDWELAVGFREVFWGVAESRHVIDQLNQRDPVTSFQGYEKLGQPMIVGTGFLSWGTIELFFLPLFRTRPFDGRAGRLWSPFPVGEDEAVIQAGSVLQPNAAVRWSHTLGSWDIGAGIFYGSRRDPRFELSGGNRWVPIYNTVAQASADGQWTTGRWLLKAEGLVQPSGPDRFVGVAGGIEFQPADFASVMLEYSYDSRGPAATTTYEHDVYLGGRLMTQEAVVQVGAFIDTSSGAVVVGADLTRRFGELLVVTVEGRAFWGRVEDQPAVALRQDSFLSIKLAYHF